MAHVVAQQGAQNNMNLGKQKMIYIEKWPSVSVDTKVIKYARPKVELWTKNRIFLCSWLKSVIQYKFQFVIMTQKSGLREKTQLGSLKWACKQDQSFDLEVNVYINIFKIM